MNPMNSRKRSMTIAEIKKQMEERKHKFSGPTDEDYREKYPAIMEAYERYQVILNLHKGGANGNNEE